MYALKRRELLRAASVWAGLGSGLVYPGMASAQEAIPLLKIFFGYPPGGAGDAITRGIGARITGSYAKAVIVENKPGAAGRLVLDTFKTAATDGAAVLVSPSSVLAMYPHVYQKLAYNSFQDVTPVTTLCDFVHGLAVGPGTPESVKTLADFIAWCKADPSKANVANPGQGSLPHFLTMLLAKSTGVPLQAIAYAGGPPGVTDLLGGQVPAMVATEGQFINYYREGKLRLLATSGAQRSRFSPNVPTFAEQGVTGIVISEWIGMFAPSKTPAAIVNNINQAVRMALENKELNDNFAKFAISAAPSTPAELGVRLKADYDFWGPTIKSTGFTPLS